MKPRLVHTVQELRDIVEQDRQAGRKIGLVPTMGALHAGHLSLVKASLAKTDRTVVSIFVNPTQFAPTEDFDKYPRTLPEDLAALESLGADSEIVAFAPDASEMYPEGFDTYVTVGGAAKPLEGTFRPTHFRGVATVVLKLFNMSRADIAFFGQKDFQQVQVIRQFVRDLNVPIQIQMCPIVREDDGLAMSSRNRYLSPEARQDALVLSQSLEEARQLIQSGCTSTAEVERSIRAKLEADPDHKVDYVAIVAPDTLDPQGETIVKPVSILLAMYIAGVRLIDNIVVK